jgi:hypothetical protein
MSAETTETMPPKTSNVLDQTLFESLYDQVQKGSLSKEQAYDQIVIHVKGSALDLPSIAKLWDTNDTKDPISIYEKIKLVLTKLVEVLQNHKTAVRIGHVFKDHFMTIWTQVLKELECHDNFSDRQWIAENVTKPILQVRDIRWILKDLEGYIIRSHLFEFKKFDIIPKSESMSRDNFYIVKKYFEDEEESKSGKYNKWTICNKCRFSEIESIQNALENEAPFNVRDQPSNQTDELWVALKYGHLKVINFLREYEEKGGRPVVFTEEHAKYLRKLGHLDTLRTLMAQFLTKEEKDGVSPPTPVPTLPEISHDQFYEKLSSGTQLRKINRELLFVDKPVDKKYFKYKNTDDSVILFYNKDTDLAKIEPELLELQKRVPQISFGKTTFDPPYYKNNYKSPITNYTVAFFRNGCSLYNNSDNESSDFLYQQIQMIFYQTTIVPENEEFATLRQKFENISSDSTMSMTDVKEYLKYNQIKNRYENLITTIRPNDNTNADDYRTLSVFEEIPVTEEEMKTSEMSREDSDYERKQRAQEAAKSLRNPKKPSVFETKDASESESFMYERSIFSRLKERYGNGVDFVRDDIDNSSEYKGWFINLLTRNPFDNSNPFNQKISTSILPKAFPTKDTPVKDIIDNKTTSEIIDVPDADPESFNLQEAIKNFYEEQKSTNAYVDKNTHIEQILSETN